MEKTLLEPVVSKILDEMRLRPIPLGVSNRHLHLSVQDYQQLFPNQPLIEKKRCSNPVNLPPNKR